MDDQGRQGQLVNQPWQIGIQRFSYQWSTGVQGFHPCVGAQPPHPAPHPSENRYK